MAAISPEEEHPVKAFGWAAKDSSGVFSPFKFSRRATGEKDVRFKVLYCGICHSDLAMVKNEWGMSQYPIVPGVLIDPQEIEHHMQNASTFTYIGSFPFVIKFLSTSVYGERFNMIVILRSGIKMPHIDKFSHLNVPNVNKAAMGTLDGIIDTVSATHPIAPLIGLLKAQGKLILVGAPEKPLELPSFSLIVGRKIVAGSCIGGLKETQEMLDFSAKHNITADVEVVPIDYVNTAMERLAKADVRYRFVIDVAGTLKAA
ncbi:hypothetical protein RJ639_015064 [Escallonia herrerae]|uniref:Alcohol dehydrogenase-like C-terminal domain-containing protein n=1 Tax=Escallonia herrerae TaxID=1293975 RepID=A0AA89ALY8_9ASTE|nr:hypothetical protein RJ639_015064 [Escallonia herrerae]